MTYEEQKRMLAGWRGRRFLACRSADLLRDCVEALGSDDKADSPPEGGFPSPPSDSVKQDLYNMITAIQRMILHFNDGHVSISTLQRF